MDAIRNIKFYDEFYYVNIIYVIYTTDGKWEVRMVVILQPYCYLHVILVHASRNEEIAFLVI